MRTLLFATFAVLRLLNATAQPPDYRPTYHFTPPKNWINDPNGLVYYDGEYHLFYQHNPFANQWGHMSWGHAVSRDLLRWEHLPLSIPEFTHADGQTKTAIFSGSSVVDRGNRNGLCPPGTADCMVAIYTGNVTQGNTQLAQYQNLAYSADRGRTWTQYAQNPIIDIGSREFRDPNVFWYAPGQTWVMATVKATEHRAAFYASKDLKNWTFLSHFGPLGDTTKVWECPALVRVPVEGEAGQSRWVLFISSGHPQPGYVGMQYFVGDFDGRQFTLSPDHPTPSAASAYAGAVVDWGKDYYAAIQYNDLPDPSASPVMIGWANNWAYAGDLPTTPFKGVMALPRQISLRRTGAGLHLIQQPIAAVANLREPATVTRSGLRLTNQRLTLAPNTGNAYELLVTLAPGTAKRVGLKLAQSRDEETVLYYTDGRLQLDRTRSGNVAFNKRFASVESAPLTPRNGLITLRIFVDKSLVEIFANDGERVITDQIFPTQSAGGITLFAEGGTADVRRVAVYPIKAVSQ